MLSTFMQWLRGPTKKKGSTPIVLQVTREELPYFLELQLKDRIKDLQKHISDAYLSLDQKKEEYKQKYSSLKTKIEKKAIRLLQNIIIPQTDHYFEAHVFVSSAEKLCKQFLYAERETKDGQEILH